MAQGISTLTYLLT